MAVILLIAYIYSFYIAPNENIPETLKNINHYCFYNCTDKCSVRGGSYIIESEEESKKIDKCLFTSWNASHFILYLILGYYYPQYYIKLALLGVAFEGYEHVKYDCADGMDIIANIAGLTLGTGIKLVGLKC